MPTGYTADIAKGITFKEYAMSCARAFGALIEMCDDPADKPIPERFEPGDYNRNRLQEAEEQLGKLRAMTPAEAEEAATTDHAAALDRWTERQASRADLLAKYEAMLASVRAYVAPTADHVEYKAFMENQIVESMRFDCRSYRDDKPTLQTGTEWHRSQMETAKHDIGYHAKGHAEEVARTETRNAWIAALRASLKD